jgi:hypothetical protein
MVDDAQGAYPRARIIANATAWNAGEWVAPLDSADSRRFYLPKHNNVAGARAWFVVATDRFVHFWTQWSGLLNNGEGALWYFGDVKPARANDAYATILTGSSCTSSIRTTGLVSGGVTIPTLYSPAGARDFKPVANFTYSHDRRSKWKDLDSVVHRCWRRCVRYYATRFVAFSDGHDRSK